MSGSVPEESYLKLCVCMCMHAFWQPANEMPMFPSISSLLDSMGRWGL